MKSLEERKKARAHDRAVASGEVVDSKVSFGTSETGDVIGNDGKPVAGTAPKGFDPSANKSKTATTATEPGQFDYTTLGTHSQLDGPDGLNGREKPEGWDTFKVVEKQAWLADNRPAATEPAGGW